jgi:hypothetical protein
MRTLSQKGWIDQVPEFEGTAQRIFLTERGKLVGSEARERVAAASALWRAPNAGGVPSGAGLVGLAAGEPGSSAAEIVAEEAECRWAVSEQFVQRKAHPVRALRD